MNKTTQLFSALIKEIKVQKNFESRKNVQNVVLYLTSPETIKEEWAEKLPKILDIRGTEVFIHFAISLYEKNTKIDVHDITAPFDSTADKHLFLYFTCFISGKKHTVLPPE